MTLRHDWTIEEISEIYHRPLLDLIYDAATIHRQNKNYAEVQVNSLISIKTGGCSEDCSYCSQSVSNHTNIEVQALMKTDEVIKMAKEAKGNGATRVCMGAAWREVRDNRDFDRILEMVREVNGIGVEVCCTLGMLTYEQAKKLADAGLYAYNHNLDSSEEYYNNVVTTRTYEDRLNTIKNVRKAGITVCSGGIIGLGEKVEDRIEMLQVFSNMEQHPESVPINALVAIEGTPLESQEPVPFDDMVRMVATARIIMPETVVRISAGRLEMTVAEQALCFMAGANSIFAGDKLLTTPNPGFKDDNEMFRILGLTPRKAFKKEEQNTEAVN